MDQITKSLLGPGECPPAIASALKEIDPDAVLLHLGGTKWWLGIEAPNPKAQEILESGIMATGKVAAHDGMDPVDRAMAQVELEKEFTMFQIMASGFRPIALYDVAEERTRAPGWDIVEDFRIRDYNFRNQTVGEHAEDMKDATSADRMNQPRIARAAQRMRDAASEAYAFVFRKRRSVGGGRLPNHGSRPDEVRSIDTRSSSS